MYILSIIVMTTYMFTNMFSKYIEFLENYLFFPEETFVLAKPEGLQQRLLFFCVFFIVLLTSLILKKFKNFLKILKIENLLKTYSCFLMNKTSTARPGTAVSGLRGSLT